MLINDRNTTNTYGKMVHQPLTLPIALAAEKATPITLTPGWSDPNRAERIIRVE